MPDLADLTPAQELAQVLPADLAADFVAHRKALKKPLIPRAARLIVAKLRKMKDPIAAVEKAIEHGWLTVYEDTNAINSSHPLPHAFTGGSSAPPSASARRSESLMRAFDLEPEADQQGSGPPTYRHH